MPDDLIARIRRRTEANPSARSIVIRTAARVEDMSRAELWRNIARWGCHFQARELPRDGLILVMLPISGEQIAAYLGAMAVGLVPALLACSTAKQQPDVFWASQRSLIARAAPAAIVTSEGFRSQLLENDAVRHDQIIITAGECGDTGAMFTPHPGDIALLQYSSGTVALRKGVMLTHQAIAGQIDAYSSVLGFDERHVIASWLPLYHDMGLIACLMMPLVVGASSVLLDPFEWAIAPDTLLATIERYRATHCWLPNFAFNLLCRTAPLPYDLSSVQAFINCSEPCKPDSFERFYRSFEANGVQREALQVCYAMAETVFAVTQTAPGKTVQSRRFDAELLENQRVSIAEDGTAYRELLPTGRVIPGLQLRIVGPDDREPVPAGRVGVVEVAGEFLFTEYFREPERTHAAILDDWYYTGDLGFIHDGQLFILGRVDDLLIIGGRNLYAHEIEETVSELPGARPGRCLALAVDDDRLGTRRLVVLVEGDDTKTAAQLARDIRGLVEATTAITPGSVLVVPSGWLIKTTSGKISRSANLRKYEAENLMRR